MEKEITNCQECPFCNNDSEFGRDGCNLNTNIRTDYYYENMPSDKVHDECPLIYEQVTVKLKS